MSWFSFADCRCPDNETTNIYNEDNSDEFTTDVDGVEDELLLTHFGADISVGAVVTIETNSPPRLQLHSYGSHVYCHTRFSCHSNC